MPIEFVINDQLVNELSVAVEKFEMQHDETSLELCKFYRSILVMVDEMDYIFDNELAMLNHFSMMFKAHTNYMPLYVIEELVIYIYSSHPLFSDDDYYTQLRIQSIDGDYYLICDL